MVADTAGIFASHHVVRNLSLGADYFWRVATVSLAGELWSDTRRVWSVVIPQDPRNPLTAEKVHLGRLLFHETVLGTRPAIPEGAGTYGCVTCHHAEAGFQAGRRQSIGDGGSGWGVMGEARTAAYGGGLTDAPGLRSPSVLNGAFQDVMHWDGSLGAFGQNAGTDAFWTEGSFQEVNRLGYDGLESQAIAVRKPGPLSAVAGGRDRCHDPGGKTGSARVLRRIRL